MKIFCRFLFNWIYILLILQCLTLLVQGQVEAVEEDLDWYEGADMDLTECLSRRQILQDKRVKTIASLSTSLEKVNTEISEATSTYVTALANRRAAVDALNAEITEQNRIRHELEVALEGKMDCHFNQETLKYCDSFCVFPYVYDTCPSQNFTTAQASIRQKYVQELKQRMRSGDVFLYGNYQRKGKTCQIESIQTMAPINLQYPEFPSSSDD